MIKKKKLRFRWRFSQGNQSIEKWKLQNQSRATNEARTNTQNTKLAKSTPSSIQQGHVNNLGFAHPALSQMDLNGRLAHCERQNYQKSPPASTNPSNSATPAWLISPCLNCMAARALCAHLGAKWGFQIPITSRSQIANIKKGKKRRCQESRLSGVNDSMFPSAISPRSSWSPTVS